MPRGLPGAIEDRTVTAEAVEMPAADHAVGRPRRRLWVVLVVLLVLAATAFVGLRALNLLPSFLNPFEQRTTVQASPVLIQSMRDMNRYVAAEGEFQVIVDVQEGRENIPGVLYGERTVVVGVGSVSAYVDFSQLATDDLTVSADGRAVRVTLPPPALESPALNTERSYVLAHEEGVANRIAGIFGNDPTDQLTYYRQAEQEIAKAAEQSDLAERARTNTTAMLTNLFRQLGFTDITVSFAEPVAR